jgi:hypothetical protein
MSNPLTKEEEEEVIFQEAVRNVLALRKLTADSKTQTSRAQGEILQNLSPALLTRVARVLAEMESAGGTDVRR